MPRTVPLFHRYSIPPTDLWPEVASWRGIEASMTGLLAYRALPRTPLAQGQKRTIHPSLFGVLPVTEWQVHIAHFDPVAMTMECHEHGGCIRRWEHGLAIRPEGKGAVLQETITIDAGLLTVPVALWARFAYRRRHKMRLARLSVPASRMER